MTALVVAEHDNASIKGATLNTVTAASHITMNTDGEIHLLVVGYKCLSVAESAAHIAGVSKVIHAEAEHLAHGLAENMAAQVLAIAANYTTRTS